MDSRENHEQKLLDLQFSQLAQPDNEFQGFAIEALLFLVQREKHRRNITGLPMFNCFVLRLPYTVERGLDVSKVQDLVLSFAENVNLHNVPQRLQIITWDRAHYTAVDIQISQAGNECIVLDAGSDMRGTIMLAHQLANLTWPDGRHFFDAVYVPIYELSSQRLQNDLLTCAIFSFDHICESSKLAMFEGLIPLRDKSGDQISYILWHDMPPEIVRNAQSMTLVENYIKRNQGKCLADPVFATRIEKLQAYISGHSIQIPRNDGVIKLQNVAVYKLFNSYQDEYNTYRRAKDLLNRLNQKRLLIPPPVLSKLPHDSLLPSLFRIVYANYWGKKIPEAINLMRQAVTLQDFHLLAEMTLDTLKSPPSIIFSDKIRNRVLKLCWAIINGDFKKINGMCQKAINKMNKADLAKQASSSNPKRSDT